MHDGYIFTLGICGAAAGPAADLLDTMLAALPPVKRAAYLGDVTLAESMPSLADPLASAIITDVADAEVLLVVAPLLGGGLPGRLRSLAELPLPPALTGNRFVALVVLGDVAAAGPALRPLRAALAAGGGRSAGELRLTAAALDQDMAACQQAAADLARAAYALARAQHPDALSEPLAH